MEITKDIRYVGVNDHEIDLFEGQYTVPKGMAYNSYVILDEKVAVMDTVDARFTHEWLDHVEAALGERQPDYLIVQHMEPDHSGSIVSFTQRYPQATVVSSAKAFAMMQQFFGKSFEERAQTIAEGSTLSLGRHELHFVAAPMVHWPEVMVTYDSCDKVLFSADGFGKFGALDAEEDWADEARRYYIGIVGKYGAASAGYCGAASAGECGAASAGYCGAASAGKYGAAVSRGKTSVGNNGAALARGCNVCAKGGMGSLLVIVEENDDGYNIKSWCAGIVDAISINPDTWYQCKDGKFVKLEDAAE